VVEAQMETGRIEYTDTAARQDYELAMRGDIIRGLVELITNADDSYARMEQRGQQTSGRILVEVEHKRGQPYRIIVHDRAEGMDSHEMRQKLVRRGGSESGHDLGMTVRGFLCRGAKDLVSFGRVTYESIKGDKYYVCNLLPPSGLRVVEAR
jgi:hypothetical protein